MIKVALIKEGKRPMDRRVALSPTQAHELQQTYPQIEVIVQKSPIRCFPDADYEEKGLKLQKDITDCDVLLGIKEVPAEQLLPHKTYLFFSHTTKKQPYNRELLQEILKKNIRLIDYEKLTDEEGNRLVAFGYWAGIVGAHNAIWTWGKRFNLFDIRRAHDCFDLQELKSEFTKVKLPAIKIALTGSGRVAKGAMEVLGGMGIEKVSSAEFLNKSFPEAVYTQISSKDYYRRRDGGAFNREDFHQNPHLYEADFSKYTNVTDLLISAAYWNPQAPKLFSKEEIGNAGFRIRVIADISCDIRGAIPSTVKASSIIEPLYDYDPQKDAAVAPLSDEKNITVMAIDNLPCELPRDASESFGRQLLSNVFPSLAGQDSSGILARATITEEGKLRPAFAYLQDFVEEKE